MPRSRLCADHERQFQPGKDASQDSRQQGCVKPQHSKLTVLDKLVIRLVGFLIDEQHEMVRFHRLDQFIDAEGLVLGFVAVEEHGEIAIRVAASRRSAAAFLDPPSNLVGLDDDAK